MNSYGPCTRRTLTRRMMHLRYWTTTLFMTTTIQTVCHPEYPWTVPMSCNCRMRTTFEVGIDLKRGNNGFSIISFIYVVLIMWHIADAIYVEVIWVGRTQGACSRNTSPTWNFKCVREIENERLEKIDRLGVYGAAQDDLVLSVTKMGDTAQKCRAYLATLSDDSE